MVIGSMSTYLEDEVGPEPTAKPPCSAPSLCISRLNGVVHQVPTTLQEYLRLQLVPVVGYEVVVPKIN